MKKSSRTSNSFKNMFASLSSNIINIIIGLIARAIFISIIGSEYLGLNGLFTNIISMLGIVELGIGSAIIYNLYKPIADEDVETIKSLMFFYKKSYRIIGVIVFIIGMLIMPFLPSITGEVTLDININIIYLLFLADIVFSYFLSYKRSILYADQKNYIVNIIHIGYSIIMNFLQLLFLYVTKNYYIYLIIKVIMRIVENIVISIIANYKYSYLKDKNVMLLDKEIEKDIFKKVKSLVFHQIGSFFINGTDNIVISKFLGLVTVGFYSNYYLIINSIQSVAKQLFDATTPSIGNILVTENKEKQYDIFNKMRFLNFWISTFCAISIYVIMDSFIKIWIGADYLLSKNVLLLLVINFYQKTSRYTYASFKNAAGIFYEDRFVPIIESIINIIVSVLLVNFIGLPGVFIGTIISGLALWCYSYPKFVYKNLFDRNYINYVKETLTFAILFLGILLFTSFIASFIKFTNIYINFGFNVIISIVIPNLILFIIFHNNSIFKYYIIMIKKILQKIIKCFKMEVIK